jgi:hypothetical protein
MKNEKIIIRKVQIARKNAMYALIALQDLAFELVEDFNMHKKYGDMSASLLNLGISTINALDDYCNGIGFILEENGFKIKGQL